MVSSPARHGFACLCSAPLRENRESVSEDCASVPPWSYLVSFSGGFLDSPWTVTHFQPHKLSATKAVLNILSFLPWFMFEVVWLLWRHPLPLFFWSPLPLTFFSELFWVFSGWLGTDQSQAMLPPKCATEVEGLLPHIQKSQRAPNL